jgi:hypothetical protein
MCSCLQSLAPGGGGSAETACRQQAHSATRHSPACTPTDEEDTRLISSSMSKCRASPSLLIASATLFVHIEANLSLSSRRGRRRGSELKLSLARRVEEAEASAAPTLRTLTPRPPPHLRRRTAPHGALAFRRTRTLSPPPPSPPAPHQPYLAYLARQARAPVCAARAQHAMHAAYALAPLRGLQHAPSALLVHGALALFASAAPALY